MPSKRLYDRLSDEEYLAWLKEQLDNDIDLQVIAKNLGVTQSTIAWRAMKVGYRIKVRRYLEPVQPVQSQVENAA